MKFLIRAIKFLVYSNVWIGLGAAAFTWQYYHIYKIPVNYALVSFAFFATISTYTFQRHIKIINKSRGVGERMEWMIRNPVITKSIMILGVIGCLFTLIEFTGESFLLLIITGGLSLFYVIKIPGKIGRNLRDIPSLKIFLIGIVWAATSTFLPYLNIGETSIDIPWILFITNFLFIIAITIPFDVRDIHLDEDEKKTIPQLVGTKKALWIAVALLLANYILLTTITGIPLIFSSISLAISILLVKASSDDAEDLYFSFFIDGILILQALFLYIDLLCCKSIV